MSGLWTPLEDEFQQWSDAGMVLPFWWRDDDAVKRTSQIDQLEELALRVGCEVHLAVIPNGVQDDLVGFVKKNQCFTVLTHGFSHQNHAEQGQKKCEFPQGRVSVPAELRAGWQGLLDRFGDRFAPVFVPPWNRFADEHKGWLQDIGYKGFSTFTARRQKWAVTGVLQVNTHVDPVDWHGSRSLLASEQIINHTVACLKDRRNGVSDNAEPFGFLTHHLVHDAAIWAFCEAFLERFLAGPTRIWSAQELKKW
jgi:hypothetical protein